MRTRDAGERLRPEHALTTTSWVLALLLLALNDHWLKQAGVLPGWLTGKLSDFAGLYVAPALLATLVRARTRAALAGCHVLIGLVYAAINLDPRCAALWAQAMAWLGFPWRIVTDAADLIALPALLASYRWLGARMTDAVRPRLARPAQHALAALGLLCCMATSDDDWDSSLWTSGPHLHNASSRELTVLVRPLRDTVRLDCDAIAEAPGRLLPDAAFGVAVAYRLGARQNLSLGGGMEQACWAARVSGAALRPAVVFWRTRDIPEQTLPESYGRGEELLPGAIALEFEDGRHTGYRGVGGDFVHDIERAPVEIGEACRATGEAARPAVSSELPAARLLLLGVDEGPDGCVALRYERLAPADPGDADMDAGVVDEPAPAEPPRVADAGSLIGGEPAAYVCLPAGMFPFQVGDTVEVRHGAGSSMTRREAGGAYTQLVIAMLAESSFVESIDLRLRARPECPYVLDEVCAQTALPVALEAEVGGQSIVLNGGDPIQQLVLERMTVDIALPFGQWRALLDSACAPGLSSVGGDAVVVAVVHREGLR